MHYAFELGREWKLSLAEIEALFGAETIRAVIPKLAVIEVDLTVGEMQEFAARMGGVIRAFVVLSALRDPKWFAARVFDELKDRDREKRITFGLGTIGGPETGIFNSGLRLKKDLKTAGYSVRLVNKDDKAAVTAVVRTEKLVEAGTEFYLLSATANQFSLARTVHIQDIDAYSARDMGKTRDMEVGMLPPKLAQMIINLAIGTTPIYPAAKSVTRAPTVYDPFCGLGTVLIEAAHMGIVDSFATDISQAMVEATRSSFDTRYWITQSNCQTALLDAKDVWGFHYLSKVTHIVTEGYLGRIFGHHTVSHEAVHAEKQNLLDIYRAFFWGLESAKWKGTVVITLPCWEVSGDTLYFGEFFKIFEHSNWVIEPLLVPRTDVRLTKYGTLIYRRPGQTVGREVVRIIRK